MPRVRRYTQARNGKGDPYAYCKACHPGAIGPRWTRERVLKAMHDWRAHYGGLPSSYDWSRTHAQRRGGEALERLSASDWPAASVVTHLFGNWARRAQRPRGKTLAAQPREMRLDAATTRQYFCAAARGIARVLSRMTRCMLSA